MELVETRELQYFVAVAEELHFRRAAARVRVAQPALSKTVQRLEARLGVTLLLRTSRSVTLTPAGEALLEQGRRVLDAMADAVQSAQRAGAGEQLRLVMKPGGDAGLLSGLLAAYAGQPEAKQVDILFSGSVDRTDFLRDGRADVALLYAPFDDLAGLTTKTLYIEDRVVVLPEAHPLATRPSVRLHELADEQFPRWRGVPSDRVEGPELADVAELLPLVRIGRVIEVLPRSLVTPAPPGIVCVAVEGAGPSSIVIACNESDHRPSVEALMSAATAAASI